MSDTLAKLLTDFNDRVRDILRMTEAAVRELARYPQSLELMKAVRDLDEVPSDPEVLKREENDLRLLQKEQERGFPFYFGLATIAIWSAMEAFFEDLVVAYMDIESPLAHEGVRKIRTTVGEYEAMSHADRLQFILETLQRDIGADRRPGVGRFESVLDILDLKGAVLTEVRACLLELSEVRHALVHRNGMADKKLISACPWIPCNEGESIPIGFHSTVHYVIATVWYASEVYERMLARQRHSPADRVVNIKAKMAAALKHPSFFWEQHTEHVKDQFRGHHI